MRRACLISAAAFAVLLTGETTASAQSNSIAPPVVSHDGQIAGAPSGPIPRSTDGRSDLTGVWEIPYVPDMSKGIGPLPYTAWGEADFKAYDPAKFDYTAHCLPSGLTRQV